MKLLRPWPDKIPSMPLGDLCDIKGGKPAPKGGFLENGAPSGVPFIRMRDLGRHHVTNNLCDYSDLLDPAFAEINGYSPLPVGSILMPRSGSVALNHRAILGIEASIVSHICALIIRDDSRCSRDYLFRVLCLMDMKKMSTKTTGLDAVSFASLKKIQIPLPPLAEQKRIAGVMDAADALRAKRRESLAQLDTLLQSTFLDMFGDPVTNPKGWKVGVIGDLLESANYGTSKKADATTGAYPILRMGNLTYSGGWDFGSLKYIDLDEKEAKKHLVYRGQILFNRTNSKELVGKTAVYREDQPMAFAGYLVRGIVNETADPEYIGAFMNTPQIKQFLQNMCKNIVGMANINAKEFQAIPVAVPPLDLQHRFAAIVDSVERQKTRLRIHLAELDTLFASLQSRAFRGDL